MYKNLNVNKNNNEYVYKAFAGDCLKQVKYDSISIDKKIRDIFLADDYVYKADVYIETDNDQLKKTIIGRKNGYLITIDNEYIPISIIRNIYKVR